MEFEKQTPLWFRWLGFHGLEFHIGEDVLHINPFFTRVPRYKHKLNLLKTDREIIRQELKTCQLILVSSADWLHTLDIPEILYLYEARVYGSKQVCDLLKEKGVPHSKVQVINESQMVKHGAFEITGLPVRSSEDDGNEIGFLIQGGGLHLRVFGEGFALADVLFLSPLTQADFEEEKEKYALLLKETHPRLVILIGWDDVYRPLNRSLQPVHISSGLPLAPGKFFNPYIFKQNLLALNPDLQVFIPEIFDRYHLQNILAGPHVPQKKNPVFQES
jgi:hypothetical protein